MAYLSNTSVNGDLGVSGLVSVGSAGLKFTSGIINIFGTLNSGGTGTSSISIGSKAAATGDYSIALGYNAGSTATDAISIGRSSKANNTSSIAIGISATDNNSYGIAIGDSAKSHQNYGIAIGYNAKSSGTNAIAIGGSSNDVSYQTTASGTNSIAIGSYGTQATDTRGVAIGYGSKVTTGTNINYNGSATTGIYFGWNNGSKYVSCSASASSWSFSSDINDKTDIEPIDHALDFINSVEPITYVDNSRSLYTEDQDMLFKSFNEEEHRKGTKKGDRRHAGVKAQQVYSELKEKYKSDNYASIVSYNKYNDPDSDEYEQYRVAYTEFIPFLIRSTQELSAIVDEQKKLIEDLQSQLNELKK